MKKILALSTLCTLTLISADPLIKEAKKAGLIAIPFGKALSKAIGNPSTSHVELGKMLYFDPRLSKSNLLSCNTCHNLATGGTDGVSAAIGHTWTANPHHLNSPTVYNSVFNANQFWDGRSPHLEDQAKGPMQAAPEMAISPEMAVSRIKSMPTYVALFQKAFPQEKESVTFENIAKVIGSFERTLVTPSRYDDFLNGKSHALTKTEKEGLKTFINKGCTSCHTNIALGGMSMQPFPINGTYKYANLGDYKGNKDGLTKVPTLRNIAETAPYMHNGAIWSLHEAVKIMGELQLGTKLSDKEITSIVTFLHALSGKKPKIIYPILPAVTDTTPKPDSQ